MVKFILYYNKDKEVEFLNEMSRQGYAVTGFCMGFYHFDRCEPGEYLYQIDLAEGAFRLSSNYREFMRDMGVEIVCLWGVWVILRKRAEEGPFVLYTDVESRITHYTKIRKVFQAFMAVEICCFLLEVWVAASVGAAAKVWAVVCLLIIMAFVREIMRINSILAELKARSGMDTGGAEESRGRKPSVFLPASLVLNAICLLLPERGGVGQLGALYNLLKGSVQLIAILLMIIGLIRTFWRKEG